MGRTAGPEPIRYCRACRARLHRKRYPSGSLEDLGTFRRRRYCNRICAGNAPVLADPNVLGSDRAWELIDPKAQIGSVWDRSSWRRDDRQADQLGTPETWKMVADAAVERAWADLLSGAYLGRLKARLAAMPSAKPAVIQSPLVGIARPLKPAGRAGPGRYQRIRVPVGPVLPIIDRRARERGSLLALCRSLEGRCDLTWKGWLRIIERARADGSLTERQAERLVVVLGSSFDELWGELEVAS